MNRNQNQRKMGQKRPIKNAKSAAPRRQIKQQRQVTQTAPVAFFKPTGPRKPQIRSKQSSKGDARICVSHSEYIADVSGSVAFSVTGYPVNPGLSSTFPWLSQLAVNYESYRFNRLRFSLRTISATSARGSLLLAMDYDAADSAPVNYQTMTNYNHCIDTQAWNAEAVLNCDRADMNKLSQRYVRTGTLASNLDIKTYDVGNFFIAALDMADSVGVGRLWVEYDVELITPQSIFALPSKTSAKIVSGGTVSKTAVFGSVPVITGGLNITCVTNTITFNQTGEFLVSLSVIGTGVGVDSVNSGTVTQTQVYSQYSASTVAIEQSIVKVTSIGQTFIQDWSASATTITSSVVRISPYEYSLA